MRRFLAILASLCLALGTIFILSAPASAQLCDANNKDAGIQLDYIKSADQVNTDHVNYHMHIVYSLCTNYTVLDSITIRYWGSTENEPQETIACSGWYPIIQYVKMNLHHIAGKDPGYTQNCYDNGWSRTYDFNVIMQPGMDNCTSLYGYLAISSWPDQSGTTDQRCVPIT